MFPTIARDTSLGREKSGGKLQSPTTLRKVSGKTQNETRGRTSRVGMRTKEMVDPTNVRERILRETMRFDSVGQRRSFEVEVRVYV